MQLPNIHLLLLLLTNSAKLVNAVKTRSSATAERQHISYARLSRLAQWSCRCALHWTLHMLYSYTKWSHISRYQAGDSA